MAIETIYARRLDAEHLSELFDRVEHILSRMTMPVRATLFDAQGEKLGTWYSEETAPFPETMTVGKVWARSKWGVKVILEDAEGMQETIELVVQRTV